jgi:hypothetical protein
LGTSAGGQRAKAIIALELIDEVLDIVASWPKLAEECGVPSEMIHQIIPNMLRTMRNNRTGLASLQAQFS